MRPVVLVRGRNAYLIRPYRQRHHIGSERHTEQLSVHLTLTARNVDCECTLVEGPHIERHHPATECHSVVADAVVARPDVRTFHAERVLSVAKHCRSHARTQMIALGIVMATATALHAKEGHHGEVAIPRHCIILRAHVRKAAVEVHAYIVAGSGNVSPQGGRQQDGDETSIHNNTRIVPHATHCRLQGERATPMRSYEKKSIRVHFHTLNYCRAAITLSRTPLTPCP